MARARLARRAVRERVELMGFSDAMMTQRRVAKGNEALRMMGEKGQTEFDGIEALSNGCGDCGGL